MRLRFGVIVILALFDACFCALTPDPIDGSTWVYRETELKWEGASADTTNYDVYLGSDFDAVNTEDPSVFQGTVNVPYFQPMNLPMNECYFWRINEKNGSGDITQGPVWSFYVPGLLGELPSDIDAAIGGRTNYSSFCNEAEAIIVTTKKDLLDILRINDGSTNGAPNPASNGATVLIPDFNGSNEAVEIDLTGEIDIPLPTGLTLCGQRGKPATSGGTLPGALLYTEQGASGQSLFSIQQSGARITGLRIRGPSPSTVDTTNNGRRGITLSGAGMDATIDNCDLSQWGYASLFLSGVATTRLSQIHHNHIHDGGNGPNLPYGSNGNLAYGIEINTGYPDVYGNVFQRVGHAIAGSGGPNCNYEARYNLVLDGLNVQNSPAHIHQFDMHGKKDFWIFGSGFCNNCCHEPLPCCRCHAGDVVAIHHNTFAWPPEDNQEGFAIVIRGRPSIEAKVYDNWFFHSSINQAVRQRYLSGNTYVGVDNNPDVPDNLMGFELNQQCNYAPVSQGEWTNVCC